LRLFSSSARHARTGRRRQLADLGSTATIMAVAFVACHRLRSGVTRVLDPLAPSAAPTAMSAYECPGSTRALCRDARGLTRTTPGPNPVTAHDA
jgi:hypothetical protein